MAFFCSTTANGEWCIREPLVTGVQANICLPGGRFWIASKLISNEPSPPPPPSPSALQLVIDCLIFGLNCPSPGINGQWSFTTVILDLDFVTAALPVCTPSHRDAVRRNYQRALGVCGRVRVSLAILRNAN